MRTAFLYICITAALAFVVHTFFAPFYETGIKVFLAPIFFILFAGLYVAVFLRKAWGWRRASLFSAIWVVINLLFPPMPEHFGTMTTFARLLISIEILACSAIFLLMRSPSIRNWLHDPK